MMVDHSAPQKLSLLPRKFFEWYTDDVLLSKNLLTPVLKRITWLLPSRLSNNFPYLSRDQVKTFTIFTPKLSVVGRKLPKDILSRIYPRFSSNPDTKSIKTHFSTQCGNETFDSVVAVRRASILY